MEALEVLERGGNAFVLVPSKRDGAADDATVEPFGAVDDAAQLIQGSDLIEVTVSKGRSLSILERFVLRAITLQAEARGKAVWVR